MGCSFVYFGHSMLFTFDRENGDAKKENKQIDNFGFVDGEYV